MKCSPSREGFGWGRRDVITQPDVFVLAPEDAVLGRWAEVRHVPLIAEVLSPSARFPMIERERLNWHPAGASLPLVIELTALFAKP